MTNLKCSAPNCPHTIEVSEIDPDATATEMWHHIRWDHPDNEIDNLLAQLNPGNPHA